MAFREGAGYFMTSDDPLAWEARDRVKRSTQGTEPFYSTTYDDLDNVCVYLKESMRLWSSADCEDAKRDLRNLLPWLARLLDADKLIQTYHVRKSVQVSVSLCYCPFFCRLRVRQPRRIDVALGQGQELVVQVAWALHGIHDRLSFVHDVKRYSIPRCVRWKAQLVMNTCCVS